MERPPAEVQVHKGECRLCLLQLLRFVKLIFIEIKTHPRHLPLDEEDLRLEGERLVQAEIRVLPVQLEMDVLYVRAILPIRIVVSSDKGGS